MWPERTYWASVREHFSFTRPEVNRILTTIFVIAFIISFSKWGAGQTFDLAYGLRNFIFSILISAFSVLSYVSVQRLVAISRGYKPEYVMWSPSFGEKASGGFWIGILIGLLLIFLSNGRLWWVALGGMSIQMLPGHRLGRFRYELNFYDWSFVSLVGPITSMALALLFKSLTAIEIFSGNELLGAAIALNVWMAIQNMFPIPNLDGSRVFFGTRLLWIFSMCLIIVTAMQVYFLGAITALITGIVLLVLLIGLLSGAGAVSGGDIASSFAPSSTLFGIGVAAIMALVILSFLLQHVGAFLALFVGGIVAVTVVLMWIIFVEKVV